MKTSIFAFFFLSSFCSVLSASYSPVIPQITPQQSLDRAIKSGQFDQAKKIILNTPHTLKLSFSQSCGNIEQLPRFMAEINQLYKKKTLRLCQQECILQ